MTTENEEVVIGDEPLIEEDLSVLDDTTDWKAKAEELEQKRREDGIKQRERTKALKSQLAEFKPKEVVPKPSPTATGELDDTQLDYFDLKGYSEPDEVEVFHKIMLKTGMTAREVLKDEYALAKVKAIQQEKAVKDATPSSTKRYGGQSTDNEDYWFQKYEATGELPKGMPHGMASKLVNRKSAQDDVHRNPYE